MAQLEVQDLAPAVVDRMADCQESRFRQVMTTPVRHAYAAHYDFKCLPTV